MENKITIIEGPTPEFDIIDDAYEQGSATMWTAAILESPYLYDKATTTLRTFDSEKLLTRCSNAWKQNQTMFLEYRDRIGLTKQTPIIAARAMQAEEGDLLMLWVRMDLQLDPDILTDEDFSEN